MLINGEKIRKELSEGIPQIPLEDLRTLQSDYPYFQAIRFLYLKRVQKEEPLLYPEALERNAIYSGDRKSLFFYWKVLANPGLPFTDKISNQKRVKSLFH